MQVEIGRACLQPICQMRTSPRQRKVHVWWPAKLWNRKIIRSGGAQSAPLRWQHELRSLVHNMVVQTMIVQQCLLLYKTHRHPPRPPLRRKTLLGKETVSGLPNPVCVVFWWEREKIGARPSSFPPPDPSANPTNSSVAPPRRQQDKHHGERWRGLPGQREPSGSEVHAEGDARNVGSQLLREPPQRAGWVTKSWRGSTAQALKRSWSLTSLARDVSPFLWTD